MLLQRIDRQSRDLSYYFNERAEQPENSPRYSGRQRRASSNEPHPFPRNAISCPISRRKKNVSTRNGGGGLVYVQTACKLCYSQENVSSAGNYPSFFFPIRHQSIFIGRVTKIQQTKRNVPSVCIKREQCFRVIGCFHAKRSAEAIFRSEYNVRKLNIQRNYLRIKYLITIFDT